MNYFIFFICVPLVHSASHMLTTTYSNEQRIAGTPKISVITTLVRQKIDDYDSVTKKLNPTQDWMKEFAATDQWKEYTEIRERVQQINNINIPDLMQRFNQPHGDHTYQRVYGCYWNDETRESSGFDEYSYDGHLFISLDLKEIRYTASVPEAIPTVMKWNKDREQLDFLKQYYKDKCVYWLKELLNFSKASLKKTGTVPELKGQSLTEPSQKIPTESDTKRDAKLKSGSASSIIPIVVGIIGIIILVILGLVIYCCWDQIKQCYNNRYYKDVQSDEQSSISEPSGPLQRKDLHSPSQ